MATKYSAMYKTIAMLLVLTMAQVYVLAYPGTAMLGRLATSDNSAISVNGSEASSGATILSGSQLQTSENATATVRLDSGTLDILPNTNLTLNFNDGSVDVNVVSGGAVLTTSKGVNGSITFNGKVERTDPAKEVSTVMGGATLPQGGGSDDGPSFGKIFGWGLVIIGGSILAAVYIPCRRRGRNPSPGTPRGPCRRGF